MSAAPTRPDEAGPVRLNLGCGPVQPAGWVNVDGSNRAKLAGWLPWLDRLLVRIGLIEPTEFGPQVRVANLRKRLPFADGSADAVYCGEVLEHFTRDDGRLFLRECYRVLRPGGVLRVRVPDNYHHWTSYAREYEAARARPRAEWDDNHTRWVQMFFREICVRRPGLRSMGHHHKWAYDEVALILEFERAGFVEVDRRALHDSRIPDIGPVETHYDLIVEGLKPHAPLSGEPQAAALRS